MSDRSVAVSDDLEDLATPNCPSCLEPMEPVVAAWWCEGCRVAVRPDGR